MIISTPTPFLIWWTQVWLNLICGYLKRQPKVKMINQREREWSHSVMSDSLQPHGLQPTRFLHPWNFPGKSTGVSCRFLLQVIFPTQGLNLGLRHCRQMLYSLINQSPRQIIWIEKFFWGPHVPGSLKQPQSIPQGWSTGQVSREKSWRRWLSAKPWPTADISTGVHGDLTGEWNHRYGWSGVTRVRGDKMIKILPGHEGQMSKSAKYSA